jgi:hypothetical protein
MRVRPSEEDTRFRARSAVFSEEACRNTRNLLVGVSNENRSKDGPMKKLVSLWTVLTFQVVMPVGLPAARPVTA